MNIIAKVRLLQTAIMNNYVNPHIAALPQFTPMGVKTESDIRAWISRLATAVGDPDLQAFPIASRVAFPKTTYPRIPTPGPSVKTVTLPALYNTPEHARAYLTRVNCIPTTHVVIFDLRETTGGNLEYMELATHVVRGKLSSHSSGTPSVLTVVGPSTRATGCELAKALSEYGPVLGRFSPLDAVEITLDEMAIHIPTLSVPHLPRHTDGNGSNNSTRHDPSRTERDPRQSPRPDWFPGMIHEYEDGMTQALRLLSQNSTRGRLN